MSNTPASSLNEEFERLIESMRTRTTDDSHIDIVKDLQSRLASVEGENKCLADDFYEVLSRGVYYSDKVEELEAEVERLRGITRYMEVELNEAVPDEKGWTFIHSPRPAIYVSKEAWDNMQSSLTILKGALEGIVALPRTWSIDMAQDDAKAALASLDMKEGGRAV